MSRLLALVVLLVFFGKHIFAVPFPTGPLSRPLDLPSGGTVEKEEDEDTAESISFYGTLYEGDGFFFLLDISGSMSGYQLERLKSEFTSSISSLTSRCDFGVVVFSDLSNAYSTFPKHATFLQKRLATEWVHSMRAVGSTHMLDGAKLILSIAHKSKKKSKRIILVGDGLPTDPDPIITLEEIISANSRRLPWDTLLVGETGSEAVEFMQALASATGGKFSHILE